MNGVRVAQPADIPELVRVINAAYRVEDFFIDGDRTTAADVGGRMQASGAAFLVIADGPRLAGSVYVTIHEGQGHFGLLAVDPARQGHGIGRRLVTAVEEHCRRAGCRELLMDYVNLRAELPAFYTLLGYVPTGETAPMPADEKLKQPAHLVLMRKEL